jgi:CBS domain-containing protein
MLTDRDIAVRSTAEGQDPWTDKVGDAMTSGVVWCFDDQEVAQAAQLMKEKKLRRLVVLNRAGQMVGIVSLGDLAVVTGNDQLAGNTLEAVSEPVRPNRLVDD